MYNLKYVQYFYLPLAIYDATLTFIVVGKITKFDNVADS